MLALDDSLFAHYENRERKDSHKGREIRKILSQICQGLYVKYRHAVGLEKEGCSRAAGRYTWRIGIVRQRREGGIISAWMSGGGYIKDGDGLNDRQYVSPQHNPTKSMRLFWCSFAPARVTRDPSAASKYMFSSHPMSNPKAPHSTDRPPA